jgi:hypothetical protein
MALQTPQGVPFRNHIKKSVYDADEWRPFVSLRARRQEPVAALPGAIAPGLQLAGYVPSGLWAGFQ